MSSTNHAVRYQQQVRLLIDILPIVMKDSRFALKGGTAINLFLRDFPRFSVDIDLTYLPIEPRAQTFLAINSLLQNMAQHIEKSLTGCSVTPNRSFSSGEQIKLTVERANTFVKIEPNYILRGSVLPGNVRDLTKACAESFDSFVAVNVMSFADIYGGKICAALDRQHPRDFFDVMMLLEKGRDNDRSTAGISCLSYVPQPTHE